jgi:hypothetical protein
MPMSPPNTHDRLGYFGPLFELLQRLIRQVPAPKSEFAKSAKGQSHVSPAGYGV